MAMTPNQMNELVMWAFVATSVVFAIIVIYYELFPKDKRKVFIGKWLANVFTVVEVRRIRAFTERIVVKIGTTQKAFPIQTEKPTFRSKRAWIYCLDIDSGQIGFEKTDFRIPADLHEMVFVRGTFKHIVAGINKPQITGFILYILLGIAIGIPSGILLGIKLLK